ncbi:MAG: hypothetical protein ACLQNE_03175 [Thermoguttaceae bacterium]|jgi:hypothetical protein
MSAVEYTNRKGDKYYLQVGKTRTGKPRYWFGRKLTGEPVESVPAGFEIYEHPQAGLVFLRKTKPSEISPLEREMLSDGIRRYAALEHFIVDVDGDSLVVYLPSMDDRQADRALSVFGDLQSVLPLRMQAAKEEMIRRSDYTKMMRFDLVNADQRMFVVRRWCFRGSVDDWIWIGGPASLAELVRNYGQHLGKESFYDLM